MVYRESQGASIECEAPMSKTQAFSTSIYLPGPTGSSEPGLEILVWLLGYSSLASGLIVGTCSLQGEKSFGSHFHLFLHFILLTLLGS